MAISDNARGLILAVSSSLFIGTSFILKKKGLKRAAAAGTRADIRVEVPSRVDELVELGVSALKPLHALSIELGTRGLPSAVYLFVWFASYYIGVGFTPCGVGGYAYLLEPLWWMGMITMIIGEIANFVAYIYAPAVLVTPLGVLSIIISAILSHFMLKERLQRLGVLGCISCIVGSVVIVIHAPQENMPASLQEIWILATQPVICVITQLNYLNKALDTFNTAIVSPIYYVMFTTMTIIASAIMFKDWAGQSASDIVSAICGFITVLSGTIMLHVTREQEPVTLPGTVTWCDGERIKAMEDGHYILLHDSEFLDSYSVLEKN